MVCRDASQTFAICSCDGRNCDGKVRTLELLSVYYMNQMVGILYHIQLQKLSYRFKIVICILIVNRLGIKRITVAFYRPIIGPNLSEASLHSEGYMNHKPFLAFHKPVNGIIADSRPPSVLTEGAV